ncbi:MULTISPECIES: efflux RND transporter permease subunit [unclassified Spirosoma]|uniref:efflux RND transporter permease subunit n=1 Tax=unclassified Spirosoma TaxID=2621999 RepID=UPI00096025D7|nr:MULTISPECIES: efflux RND transporter permease subunit [unclassified Spirosoma]MBN8825285.1 efflux RND transporter permease subunit [Spirosoma sp.]OJW77541.1 MAG: acriflavin resistance protein [Spirosoma sp. 48-14]
MSLPELSLNRPVFAMVMSIVIVLFGVIGFTFLGVREYPAIDPPVISVRTNYTGANPEIIESQITEPIEKSLNSIEGIRTISSISALGASTITVEFNLDANLEQAANDVRDKVAQAQRQLPQDIDAPPVVTKADANSDPIIFMNVQSTTRSATQLSDYAENVLQERLQTIPGVSQANIFGLKRQAMRLWIDPIKLSAYRLTSQDIQAALTAQNVELPGGKVYGNNTELTVKAVGRLTSEDDFNNLILRQTSNQIIRFKDVGYATLGAENEETSSKQNGTVGVILALIPQPGANYVNIADEFYKRFDQLKKDLPPDIIVYVGTDRSIFIRRAIEEVGETLLISFILVVLVIYLFFRDWLIAFRPLIDIPVSLIGAFFIMYVADFSINVLTLLGIVLATGLVVDDGIVVTENIFKKVEDGMDTEMAAKEGSNEIFFAVISTSITLAIVFLPIIFLQGFVGRLFREFGIVVAGAVLISAFVSLTLTPVLSVKLTSKNHGRSWFYRKTEPFFEWLDESYRDSLNGFMKKRGWAFAMIGVCLLLIFGVGSQLKSELAPLEDRGRTRIAITSPEGTSFEVQSAITDKVLQFVLDSIPENKLAFSVVAPGFSGAGAVNSSFVMVNMVDAADRKRSQQDIVDYLTKNLRKFSEARMFATQDQTIQVGRQGGGLPVQFVIQNLNFEKLREKMPAFLEEVQKDPTFLNSDVDLKFNKPELNITIEREKATNLGVSVQDVAQTLQLALSNRRLAYFLMNGKQYQVIGQVDRHDRDEPVDLASFYVRSNQGQLIQLDNLVKFQEVSSPPQVYHYNRFKSATVSAGLAPGKTIGDGVEAMRAIAARTLDDTFQTALSGPSRDYAESSSNTLFAFGLALVLIYLVLAAQFDSFIDPFIIMMTVPLALAGAVFSLWMFNQTLNIFSQIGIIMLVGLVTKNGILIVEFANEQRLLGKNKFEAAAESAALRLRPILMTTLVAAFGALPLAMALGSASKSRVPLGIVIVGGLLFSLVLTLYVVPVIYTYMTRRKDVKPVEPQAGETPKPAQQKVHA